MGNGTTGRHWPRTLTTLGLRSDGVPHRRASLPRTNSISNHNKDKHCSVPQVVQQINDLLLREDCEELLVAGPQLFWPHTLEQIGSQKVAVPVTGGS